MSLEESDNAILYDYLVKFLSYVRPEGDDGDILYVSLQFLANSRENQLAEVIGLVRNAECRQTSKALAQTAG